MTPVPAIATERSLDGARAREPLTAVSYQRLAGLLGSTTRARAVLKWLYAQAPTGRLPNRLAGVAQQNWNDLRASCELPRLKIIHEQVSTDTTRKLVLDLEGATVETVLIPGRTRSTVCVSSQSGCTRRCTFCATAKMGFGRPLTAGEIVAQYVLAQRLADPCRPARNVVFMGMGEPLDNLGAVVDATELLAQKPLPALSPAHLTVSTSGVLPGIKEFFRRCRAHLALSLNATDDATRERLMPHNRRWPIRLLLDAVREHCGGKTVFVEYVLFAGINDRPVDADRLPELLEGIPARVNVIPFNGFPGSAYAAPSDEAVRRFQQRIAAAGLRCIARVPRGRDIAAACGQLAGGTHNTRPRLCPQHG